jgi:hypothetical protein
VPLERHALEPTTIIPTLLTFTLHGEIVVIEHKLSLKAKGAFLDLLEISFCEPSCFLIWGSIIVP